MAKLVNYVRGKTWLAVPFASNTFANLLGRDESAAEDCEWLSFTSAGVGDNLVS